MQFKRVTDGGLYFVFFQHKIAMLELFGPLYVLKPFERTKLLKLGSRKVRKSGLKAKGQTLLRPPPGCAAAHFFQKF